jgi:hypothetical protein
MKWVVSVLLAAVVLCAADAPRLILSKKFPGSKPEFMQIVLDPGGAAEYREAVDEDLPVKFKLSEAETRAIFELADKLEHFQHPLEAQVKVPVAFMGAKTFAYQSGSEKHEVSFNYSADPNAQALQDWFERMAESAQYSIELERAAKYDRLGVDKALRNLMAALDRNRLVGAEQYLPMLDRIAKNESYMHTARAKAAAIAEAIRTK